MEYRPEWIMDEVIIKYYIGGKEIVGKCKGTVDWQCAWGI
jgi:hypothetical protein